MWKISCTSFFLVLLACSSFAYEEYQPRYTKIVMNFYLDEPFGEIVVAAEVNKFSDLKEISIRNQSQKILLNPAKIKARFPKSDINNLRIFISHDIGEWLANQSQEQDKNNSDPAIDHFSICLPYGDYSKVNGRWLRNVLEITVNKDSYSLTTLAVNNKEHLKADQNRTCTRLQEDIQSSESE